MLNIWTYYLSRLYFTVLWTKYTQLSSWISSQFSKAEFPGDILATLHIQSPRAIDRNSEIPLHPIVPPPSRPLTSLTWLPAWNQTSSLCPRPCSPTISVVPPNPQGIRFKTLSRCLKLQRAQNPMYTVDATENTSPRAEHSTVRKVRKQGQPAHSLGLRVSSPEDMKCSGSFGHLFGKHLLGIIW